MKKMRIFAWLLIIAMLAVNGLAFGEELTIDLPEGEDVTLTDGIEVEDAQEGIDLGIEEVEIPLDLISIDIDADIVEGSFDDIQDNSRTGGNSVVSYRPAVEYDSNALFAGYVEQLFNGKDILGLKSNAYLGDRLTGVAADVYDYLREQIKAVAAGTINYTDFLIPESVVSAADVDVVESAFSSIVQALWRDLPYSMYWSTGDFYYENIPGDGFHIRIEVNSDFGIGTYTTDAAKIQSVQSAHENALAVNRLYDELSDYKKLCGYRDYICGAADGHAPYHSMGSDFNTEWDLIWVFDGDPDTNVNSSGYAKAFQYLCDHGHFEGPIQSHIVDGWYDSSSDPDYYHMWNTVTMEDGKNYHVDVEMYDHGYTRHFLGGVDWQGETYGREEYTIGNTYYQYDSSTLNVYPSNILKLSTTNYDPDYSAPYSISIKQGDSATVYMGSKLTLNAIVEPSTASTKLKWSSNATKVATVSQKGVVYPKKAGRAKITVTTDNKLTASIVVKVVDASSVKIKKGSATLKKGGTISLKPGKSATLKAAVSPAKVSTKLTWTSSSKYVTVKNGKVTVKANAKVGTKAKITVKTANGKSNYIYVVVK